MLVLARLAWCLRSWCCLRVFLPVRGLSRFVVLLVFPRVLVYVWCLLCGVSLERLRG